MTSKCRGLTISNLERTFSENFFSQCSAGILKSRISKGSTAYAKVLSNKFKDSSRVLSWRAFSLRVYSNLNDIRLDVKAKMNAYFIYPCCNLQGWLLNFSILQKILTLWHQRIYVQLYIRHIRLAQVYPDRFSFSKLTN